MDRLPSGEQGRIVDLPADRVTLTGETFAAIVAGSARGLVVLESDGRIVHTNAAAEALLCKSAEDLSGTTLGVPCTTGATEICVVAADKSLRFLDVSYRPLPETADGSVLATLTDVTSYCEAREQARIEAGRLDGFLAMLSHELRNPLGALQSAFELLRKSPPGTKRHIYAREVADRQFQQIRRLLDDLLDVSRMTRDELDVRTEPIPLRDVIERGVESVRPAADEAGHKLSVEFSDDEPWVDGDADRLTQVAGNLLSNAVRYTPAGGVITVSLTSEEGHAGFRVQDNGGGIPEDLLPNLFEPFTRGPDSAVASSIRTSSDTGMGIGLSLVRKIVELHAGSIVVENLSGAGGCRFEVRLPRIEPPVGSGPADNAAAVPPQSRRKRRVVLAEDNADLNQLMTLILEGFGNEVISTADGESAAAAIAEQRPDAVVLDIGLPGLTGYEVAERARAMEGCETLPLIALTGYGRTADEDAAFAAGFDAHMTKPPDFQRLRQMIEALAPV